MRSRLICSTTFILILLSGASLTACQTKLGDDEGIAVSDANILAFDDAMEQLVNGLNELSRKDKDFGMLLDEVNVSFSLSKQSDKKFGVDFNAKAESTANTSFESFYVEKGGATRSAKSSTGSKLLNSILGSSDGEKTENKSEKDASAETTDTTTESTEGSNKIAGNVGTTAGVGVTANYSSTVVGSGQNVIAIKFKSLGSYPNEKIQALSSIGMLGCLPFYVQVLGVDIADKDKVALLDQVIGSSENIVCDSSSTLTSIAETKRRKGDDKPGLEIDGDSGIRIE